MAFILGLGSGEAAVLGTGIGDPNMHQPDAAALGAAWGGPGE